MTTTVRTILKGRHIGIGVEVNTVGITLVKTKEAIRRRPDPVSVGMFGILTTLLLPGLMSCLLLLLGPGSKLSLFGLEMVESAVEKIH